MKFSVDQFASSMIAFFTFFGVLCFEAHTAACFNTCENLVFVKNNQNRISCATLSFYRISPCVSKKTRAFVMFLYSSCNLVMSSFPIVKMIFDDLIRNANKETINDGQKNGSS